MQRVSVSTLEKFSRYMREASEWDTEAQLLETIRGEFTGNPKTRCGGAYHQIIEGIFSITDEGMYLVKSEKDNIEYLFTKEQVIPALEYRDRHPLMVREIPATKVYSTPFGPYQVSLRIDGLEGRIIHDPKTKYGSWAVQDYVDSNQWKIYLDVFGVEHFKYQIFPVTKCSGQNAFHEEKGKPFWTEGQFNDPIEIDCFAYEGMEQEIQELINGFVEYIHEKDLHKYLKPAMSEELTF